MTPWRALEGEGGMKEIAIEAAQAVKAAAKELGFEVGTPDYLLFVNSQYGTFFHASFYAKNYKNVGELDAAPQADNPALD